MLNKIRLKSLTGLIGIPLTMLALSITDASAEQSGQFKREVLSENQVELTSNTVNAKTIKVTIPASFKTPDHTHEGPGPRYVVKGKLKVIEGDKVGVYSAGDVFWESGELMSVENVGKGDAELIIFEISSPKKQQEPK